MKMQKRLRGLILATVMTGMALVANAATMTVSTYYPSPYGSYVNLETTNQTHLATGGGNVGIGVAAAAVPAQRLEVVGVIQSSQALYLGSANQQMGHIGNNTLFVNVNGAERLRINSAGDVGVGTAGPGAKLDVNGSVHVGGVLRMTNGGPAGDVKVTYVAAGGNSGYYAVYAP